MSRRSSFGALRDEEVAPIMPEAMPATVANTNRNTPVPPSRVGRSQLGVYVHPQLAKSIKLLSVKQGRTVQAVMIEALNDVLRKHGESPIGNEG